ncbi:MAG TPA: universal stress protein [Burkholderiales bacterium]|jgi:nucleotide-binding universal stress UspA family protein
MSAYRRILVAVDGSATSMKGLREAIRLAKDDRAQLFVLHVVNELYAFANLEGFTAGVDIVPALREGGRRVLAKATAVADKEGIRAKTLMRETPGGAAADLIVREARKQRADLIVLGTHGRRGLRRAVLGSDAEQVVRRSPVPVLLVRTPN